jgi:hypothetical protein
MLNAFRSYLLNLLLIILIANKGSNYNRKITTFYKLNLYQFNVYHSFSEDFYI